MVYISPGPRPGKLVIVDADGKVIVFQMKDMFGPPKPDTGRQARLEEPESDPDAPYTVKNYSGVDSYYARLLSPT